MRTRALAAGLLSCGLLLLGCTPKSIEPDRPTDLAAPSGSVVAPPTSAVGDPSARKAPAAPAGPGSGCTRNALERSTCLIDAILKDVMATYTHVGGGGITGIKAVATNRYTVSISQEERIDLITYDLEVKPDGQVVITKRVEGTESSRR
jgi:hypothetical protein